MQYYNVTQLQWRNRQCEDEIEEVYTIQNAVKAYTKHYARATKT